jgi:hypothetical protein
MPAVSIVFMYMSIQAFGSPEPVYFSIIGPKPAMVPKISNKLKTFSFKVELICRQMFRSAENDIKLEAETKL